MHFLIGTVKHPARESYHPLFTEEETEAQKMCVQGLDPPGWKVGRELRLWRVSNTNQQPRMEPMGCGRTRMGAERLPESILGPQWAGKAKAPCQRAQAGGCCK